MSHQNLKEKFAAKVNVFSVSKIGFVDVLIPLPARWGWLVGPQQVYKKGEQQTLFKWSLQL